MSMLLSTPGLARYFLHRALLSDDMGWAKWLTKHQKALLKADQKHGLVVQWLKWNAKPLMVQRLIQAGCLVESTSKQPDPWSYLIQHIREQSKLQAMTYYPSDHALAHLDDSFEQLEILSKFHPDARGLELVSRALLFHLKEDDVRRGQRFHQIKLVRRYACLLLLQMKTLGPTEAMTLSPHLGEELNQCVQAFKAPSFQEFLEDNKYLDETFETFRIFHARQALDVMVPKTSHSEESVHPRKAARL